MTPPMSTPGVVLAAPGYTLGTANTKGAATTVAPTDSTLLAFDATVPTTIVSAAAAATGSAAVAARRDHTHGAPTLVPSDVFALILASIVVPTYKGLWWVSGGNDALGSSAGVATGGGSPGLGVAAITGTTGIVGAAAGTDSGAFLMATGITSGSRAQLTGPNQVITSDYTVFCRFKAPASANQTIVVGQTTNQTPTDQNGLIGFRVSGAGNVFGVVDNAGTETTRDMGASAATEAVYHYVVSAGGTIVRFYKNNVQVGADVTTNIPALTTGVIAGISTQTTADKSMTLYEFGGYREVA